MNKLKLFAALGVCGFVLGACGDADTTSTDDSTTMETEDPTGAEVTEDSTSTETDDSTATETADSEPVDTGEPGLESLDESVSEEIAKIGSEEDVNWDDIHLNKRQFKEYIESLDDENAEMTVDNEDSPFIVSSTMIDDSTIEIVINNPDTSEMSEFTNGVFALIMDSFSRQLYLSSDFSDGTTQPTIIIKDNAGNVISEATDFIEMEE